MDNMRRRLTALLEAVIEDSRIAAPFRPVIINMAKSFLASATDEELRQGVIKLRDEIIPFLLDNNDDENQNQE